MLEVVKCLPRSGERSYRRQTVDVFVSSTFGERSYRRQTVDVFVPSTLWRA